MEFGAEAGESPSGGSRRGYSCRAPVAMRAGRTPRSRRSRRRRDRPGGSSTRPARPPRDRSSGNAVHPRGRRRGVPRTQHEAAASQASASHERGRRPWAAARRQPRITDQPRGQNHDDHGHRRIGRGAISGRRKRKAQRPLHRLQIQGTPGWPPEAPGKPEGPSPQPQNQDLEGGPSVSRTDAFGPRNWSMNVVRVHFGRP